MTATLLKGFVHDGAVYKEGDKYEGGLGDLELLARQGYCDPPEEPKPTEGPKPVTKGVLAKGFLHDGHMYKEGDTFEGSASDVELLKLQGYLKEEKEKEKEKETNGGSKSTPTAHSYPTESGVHSASKKK